MEHSCPPDNEKTLHGYLRRNVRGKIILQPQNEKCLTFARMCQAASCSSNQLGSRRYMNMDHLFKPEDNQLSDIIAG